MLKKTAKYLLLVIVIVLLLVAAILVQAQWQIRQFTTPLPGDAEIQALLSEEDGPVSIAAFNTAMQRMADGRVFGFPATVLRWADGRILIIDTGMEPGGAQQFGGFLERFTGAEPIQVHASISSQLVYQSADIRAVVLTHVHMDHVGGLPALCSAGGPEIAVFQTYPQANFKNFSTHEGFELLAQNDCIKRFVLEHGRALAAIPGFPGVAAYAAGGHTPGSTVFFAAVSGHTWILAGDITHNKRSIGKNLPKPLAYSLIFTPEDRGRLEVLRVWLGELDTRPSMTVVAAHDIDAARKDGMPEYRRVERLDKALFDLQGHRGARGLLPENTLPAFIRAFDLGVTTLELDVVLAKGNAVVISHEPWFSAKICSHPDGTPVTEDEQQELNIFTLSYQEVAAFDCGSRGNPRFPDQQAMAASKPLLRDVLTAIEAHSASSRTMQIRYNIEIKSRPGRDGIHYNSVLEYAQSLYDVLTDQGVLSRTAVQSFDPRALEAMKKIDPDVELVLLIENTAGFSDNLDQLSFTPEIYSPAHELVDRALIDQAHRLGIRVIPWTVNDQSRMQELIAMGIDGLITDYPDRALAVLSPTLE